VATRVTQAPNDKEQVRHEVAYKSCSHGNGGNHPCHRVNPGA